LPATDKEAIIKAIKPVAMKKTCAVLVLFVVLMPALVFGQGTLTPPGAPGPTMKSLQDLWDKLVSLSSAQKFTAFTNANATVAGGAGTGVIPIAVGKTVKLEAISVTTYYDASATVYLRYMVRMSSGSSRIMVQTVPLGPAITDPVSNTRSGTLLLPMWISGGGVFDVANGEVHTLEVHVQSSAGATAQSSWVLTGSYATP
jgi:hypothetical protein